jgi:hypothetical protein
MGLFGSKPEKQARWADAAAESERLRSLPVRDLAAEVMRAFAPEGMKIRAGYRHGPVEVVSWLLPGAPVRYRQPILGPVIEALGVLEHANLLTRRQRDNASNYYVSRLGAEALAAGTVRQELGLDGA